MVVIFNGVTLYSNPDSFSLSPSIQPILLHLSCHNILKCLTNFHDFAKTPQLVETNHIVIYVVAVALTRRKQFFLPAKQQPQVSSAGDLKASDSPEPEASLKPVGQWVERRKNVLSNSTESIHFI